MSKNEFDETRVFTLEGFETTYQAVSFTVASASSTAISTDKSDAYVLLFADQDCHVRSTSGASTALVTDTFLPASIQTPYFITPGNIISVIRDSADGTLHISPVA